MSEQNLVSLKIKKLFFVLRHVASAASCQDNESESDKFHLSVLAKHV